MNDPKTIEDRMQKAGLPYEVTNMETPQFMLSGGDAVVAIWKDSQNDDERAFVGYHADTAPRLNAARAANRVRGVHTVYMISAERLG